MKGRVLITGTTSGVGHALLEQYLNQGWDVIAVNRRQALEMEKRFFRAQFYLTDITDPEAVLTLCTQLTKGGLQPDVVILNAGINCVDNEHHLALEQFNKILATNLTGTLSFVQAAQMLRWTCTLVGISSTSTLVPNSKNLGYWISKLSIHKLFKLLSLTDPKRCYKVVLLGPVDTNLNRGLPAQTGLQKKIFDALALPADQAAGRCIRFIHSNARVSYPPFLTSLFYMALKLFLILRPSFYYKAYRSGQNTSVEIGSEFFIKK